MCAGGEAAARRARLSLGPDALLRCVIEVEAQAGTGCAPTCGGGVALRCVAGDTVMRTDMCAGGEATARGTRFSLGPDALLRGCGVVFRCVAGDTVMRTDMGGEGPDAQLLDDRVSLRCAHGDTVMRRTCMFREHRARRNEPRHVTAQEARS